MPTDDDDKLASLSRENKLLQEKIRLLEAANGSGATPPSLAIGIDDAPFLVFGVDSRHLITAWNRKAAQSTGQTTEEAVGRNILDFLTDADHATFVENCVSAVASNFEVTLVGKSEKHTLLLQAKRQAHGDGATAVLLFGFDISERKKAEAEVAREATELRTFIDVATTPIFGVDQNGCLNEWNHMTAEISGFPKEEVLGKGMQARSILSATLRDPSGCMRPCI